MLNYFIMTRKSLMIIIVFMAKCFLCDDAEAILTKKIASCWLIAVRDISVNNNALDQIIDFHKAQGHLNRTAIFYKVQTHMISQCIDYITIQKAEQIIADFASSTDKQPTLMAQIVTSFDYLSYQTNDLDMQLTETEESILRLTKSLELQLEQKKKESQKSKTKDANAWKEALSKTGQKTQQELNQLEKEIRAEFPLKTGPTIYQYIFVAVVLGALAIGGLTIIRIISKADQSTTKKKKKNKK